MLFDSSTYHPVATTTLLASSHLTTPHAVALCPLQSGKSWALITTPHAHALARFLQGDMLSARRGVAQASYRITVTKLSGPGVTSPVSVWDSGDVASSTSSNIEYAGTALTPFSRYAWTAEWTSTTGTKSGQTSANFETGCVTACFFVIPTIFLACT
jgi:alpha-L-rhamnosidase